MAAPRRFPAALPGPLTCIGLRRREALTAIAQDVRARELHGQELRAYVYRVRAQIGSDDTIALLIDLADKP